MVAIITDNFKRKFIDQIINDVGTTSGYYVAIGRSEDWDSSDTVPNPTNSLAEQRRFRESMQSVKLGEDVSYVIPRNNWSSGTTYSAYDDAVAGYPTNAYYVITDELQVYICLQQGKTTQGIGVPSSIKPTGTTLEPQTKSDGYVWRYLYSLSAGRATKFQSSNYTPVEFIDSSADPAGFTVQQAEQRVTQYAAVKGEVLDVVVTAGGSGYTSAPTVSINGLQNTYDGVPPKTATATAVVHNGTIVDIKMDDSGTGKAFGRGYTFANVSLSGGGGSGGTARAVLSPFRGLGGDPREELRATAVMFNCKTDGAENNTFVVGNDFRQVALMRNPRIGPDSDDSAFVGNSANTLKTLKLTSGGATFSPDKTILGASSNARALIDKVDSNRLYFHQTSVTGFTPFQEAETISEVDGAGTGSLDSAGADADTRAFDSADIDLSSGEILYIDNRAAITRSAAQQEDFKIIIQL